MPRHSMVGTASLQAGWEDYVAHTDDKCTKCNRTIFGHVIEARSGAYKIYCTKDGGEFGKKGEPTPMSWSAPEVLVVRSVLNHKISRGLFEQAREEIDARMK